MALDDPGPVVGILEGMERVAQLLDGAEAPDLQEVFLERSDEPLGRSRCLGLANKGKRWAMMP